MKKIIALSLVVMTILSVGLFAGCSSQQSKPAATEAPAPAATAAPAPATAAPATQAPAPAATEAPAAQQNNDKIDIETAKTTALTDAGLDASQVQFTKEKFDTDDGVEKYEIEFTSNGYEYDYDINAKTGAIFEKGKEPVNDD